MTNKEEYTILNEKEVEEHKEMSLVPFYSTDPETGKQVVRMYKEIMEISPFFAIHDIKDFERDKKEIIKNLGLFCGISVLYKKHEPKEREIGISRLYREYKITEKETEEYVLEIPKIEPHFKLYMYYNISRKEVKDINLNFEHRDPKIGSSEIITLYGLESSNVSVFDEKMIAKVCEHKLSLIYDNYEEPQFGLEFLNLETINIITDGTNIVFLFVCI